MHTHNLSLNEHIIIDDGRPSESDMFSPDNEYCHSNEQNGTLKYLLKQYKQYTMDGRKKGAMPLPPQKKNQQKLILLNTMNLTSSAFELFCRVFVLFVNY